MTEAGSGRRHRLAIAVTALVTAVVLVAVAWALHRGTRPVADGSTVPASPTPNDGVLRTPGCANYTNQGPTRIQGTPVSGNDELVNELNNRITPYATEHFADVWGEPAVTDLGRLRLYRKPSAAFDVWIMHDFAGDCVEIADAKASAVEMEQRTMRIDQDSAYWKGRGIQIEAVGGNLIDGVVDVVVPADKLTQARQEIPARYSDLTITVTNH
jgi:hypothetical protein